MSPEDVKAEWVEKGVAALYTDSFAEWQALPSIHRKLAMEKHATNVAVALAAVLPEAMAEALEAEALTDRYDRPSAVRLVAAADALREGSES
jgi:hypothetical protein